MARRVEFGPHQPTGRDIQHAGDIFEDGLWYSPAEYAQLKEYQEFWARPENNPNQSTQPPLVAADAERMQALQAALGRQPNWMHSEPNVFDEGQAAAARAQQQQAMGLMQTLAQGNGPSAAAIGQQIAQGQAQTQANVAGATGNPLAMRSAMFQGQQGMGGAATQGAQGVGQEWNQAMTGYAGATNAARDQDIRARQQQLDNVYRQKQLGLEGMTQNYALGRGLEDLSVEKGLAQMKQEQDAYKLWAQKTGQNENMNAQKLATVAQTMGGIAGAALMSDDRAKEDAFAKGVQAGQRRAVRGIGDDELRVAMDAAKNEKDRPSLMQALQAGQRRAVQGVGDDAWPRNETPTVSKEALDRAALFQHMDDVKRREDEERARKAAAWKRDFGPQAPPPVAVPVAPPVPVAAPVPPPPPNPNRLTWQQIQDLARRTILGNVWSGK